jgi:hypothetical protein
MESYVSDIKDFQEHTTEPFPLYIEEKHCVEICHSVPTEDKEQSFIEIQQEDPSENYAPTLGWSLRLFLGGSLFIDDILFIDVCRLLLSLNNS